MIAEDTAVSDASDPELELQPIHSEDDICSVRLAVKIKAIRAGLTVLQQTKVITAASELARNALTYGKGGLATVEKVRFGSREGVQVTIADSGPGIADVDQALIDGYTTGGGMGLGLGGARRLCDEFSIDSRAGIGTRIVIRQWN